MSDIATIWNTDAGIGDWALAPPYLEIWTDENGDAIVDEIGRPVNMIYVPGDGLIQGQDLYTAVLISLFTDAEAGPDDVIPDGSGDPRGWWGGPIGSKIWLRLRERATPTVLALVKNDIEEALAWMIEDDVVTSIDVITEWTRPGLLGASVTLRRANGTKMAMKFSRLWENI